MTQVILKPRKARPFFGRHPWVLDSAIDRIQGSPADGDVVDLISDKDKFIARGIYNSRSRIRVRLYSWRPDEPIDDGFWRKKLEAALRLRQHLGYDDPQGAARVVFSEGDLLSGLVVDRFANYLVVQITALAMAVRLETILSQLLDLLRPAGILLRTERDVAKAEGLDDLAGFREKGDSPHLCEAAGGRAPTEGWSRQMGTVPFSRCWGELPQGPLAIVDGGLRYQVDLAGGQKTGFYLDQRVNRKAAAAYFRDRRVLDMFCYSGGFALCASALGGARDVLGVDASRRAVALAETNAQLNGLANVHFETGDCFQRMESLRSAGEKFGGLVLDPPKFANSRRSVDDALRAYHHLNRLAVELLEPGGILVTCSCSGHVTREDFFDMLLGVAQQTGRELQILDQRGAAPDHPIAATCPESEYLKCFICRVL
jgi:23S rRNA (cytosine1962-C5)-methyltransferase